MAKYNHTINKETFEEIERYLLNRMDNETRRLFEKRMESDTELAAEVSLQQELFSVIEASSLFTGREEVKSPETRYRYLWWYSAAAAILLFATVSIWFFNRSDNSTDSLYATYFQTDPGLPTEMGTADSVAYPFYDGMISYKEGNYSRALLKWRKSAQIQAQRDTLQYYIGMAYLNKGDTDKGITILKQLLRQPGSAYHEQANWYMALAYLKKGDKNTAKILLQNIRSYPGALSLLEKL